MGRIGVGASYVEYEGFLGSAAGVISPSVRWERGRWSVAGQGSWTVFESGRQVGQGTLAASALAGKDWWRIEGATSLGLSKYSASNGEGHLLGTVRVHLLGRRMGLWTGVTSGSSAGGGDAVTPVEVATALWIRRGRLSVVGSTTAAWLDGGRTVDLLGSMRWVDGQFEIEGRVGHRWTREGLGRILTGGRTSYGEVIAAIPIHGPLGLTLGGGRYPSDPVRRGVAARYLNAGLTLRAFGREPPRPRPEPVFAPDAGAMTGVTRFAVGGTGSTRRIEVRSARGIARIELMADFTDWEPVALARVGPTTWRLALPMEPGVYRFNLRVDGGEWTVPAGVRAETTEFGGRVGIVVVR